MVGKGLWNGKGVFYKKQGPFIWSYYGIWTNNQMDAKGELTVLYKSAKIFIEGIWNSNLKVVTGTLKSQKNDNVVDKNGNPDTFFLDMTKSFSEQKIEILSDWYFDLRVLVNTNSNLNKS